MKLKDWLKDNQAVFGGRDLRFILGTLICPGRPFILEGETVLSPEKIERLRQAKVLYLRGIPAAYILGKEVFYGREFKVSPDVLIPRQETELIVEKAIAIIKQCGLRYVLDLCTGSGNIGINIKKGVPGKINVFCSDKSAAALKLARDNALAHKAGVIFINTDLLSGFTGEAFDLIVANPPYVESGNIGGSLKAEPRQALEAGRDGLRFIRKILRSARRCLKPKGYLIMEIGYKHKHPVSVLLEKFTSYAVKEWIKDYAGHWRGVVLQRRG